MDVPVVAASGFEGDIHDTAADVGQIALPDEILAVGIGVRLASTFSCFERKSTAAMKSSVLMSGEAVRRGSPLYFIIFFPSLI